MPLCFLVVPGYTCRNYAENIQKQYNDTLRMQHNKFTHIVLTIYTALCGLHRTAYEVSIRNSITSTRVVMHTLYVIVCGNPTKTA